MEFGRRISERWRYISSVALLATAFLGLNSPPEASAGSYAIPNVFAGQYYSLRLPQGEQVNLNLAVDIGTTRGRTVFGSSPWNYLGYKYINSQNTYDPVIVADKGLVLWLDVHSGGAKKQLPGDRIIRSETSFYGNPDIYLGWQEMKVEDIRVVYVKDVIENERLFSDRLLTVADHMKGHVFIQTCYPPYFTDRTGEYVGANVLLIGADKK